MCEVLQYQGFETALSLERFGRYLEWAGGDREKAILLYSLNTRISEAFYPSLQMLEVSLRNRIHTVMTDLYNNRWIFDERLILNARHQEQIASAREDIKESKKEETPDRVVAELTFSFWTAMLGPSHDALWNQGLHKIAKKADGKGLRRKDLSSPLTPIRVLRNRIAHHEPIIAWNLRKHHSNIQNIILWLSPAAHDWCNDHCRFNAVYPTQRIELIK
ncbi:Abi family protein [Pseudovibrio sp. Tun.PSC04-5.I4]|uniref:Abi family protein n=1 Tax=Pseudovibrio sp. Tun.PSC04-5.I4 TaxID=1798213 RepID=UPI00088FDF2A|nr:Abi family protein [Pseudovibrio sp. Tun.PSC04-5.I4]SDQ29099.1 Abi-like protein [Pseudovibrio sp. Tun.PSC04-5.I4]SDR48935.1 Abi-like protein [Pseudovibrio sp. Tun.PSC04-5.I4]